MEIIEPKVINETLREEWKELFEKRKPLTKQEIENPMRKKEDPLYNAIYCYGEQNNICGYMIQVRVAKNDIYKARFYIALIDESWKGIKNPEDLPDKKVKVTYYGEYQSQNELFRQNNIATGLAMLINLAAPGTCCLKDGYVGIVDSNLLYNLLGSFQRWGYQVNEPTMKSVKERLFF